MNINNPRYVYWTYCDEFNGQQNLTDPRIIVARHIGWFKTSTEYTDFPLPEPDNYNRAILTLKPVECTLIEDQVIYLDTSKQVWITLMYVPYEQIQEIDSWINQQTTIAKWRHNKPPKLKSHKHLLWTRHNISDTNMTDNERLYTMGYYEDLKVKYFNDDPEYVDSLLGESRDLLKNYVPEEHSEEVDDL